MKALVKAAKEPGIWLQEVAIPEYGVNEVLIKIHKTSICGTDMHIYEWDSWAEANISTPIIVGHEFSGEIAAIGSEVQGLNVGQRVSGEGHITCGHCRNCCAGKRHLCRNTFGIGVRRDGCFAEYMALPASNVVALPDSISSAEGAILDPLGNAIHCALAFDVVGEDILITGAGPIGIMAAGILRHIGARHVVVSDVNDYRLALAKQMGATRTINIQQEKLQDVVSELGMTEGFDIGLEMSGNAMALNDLVGAMNNGGRIAVLGIQSSKASIDWNQVIFKGLTIKGIYGREMYETWYKMIALLQSGLDVKPVITHCIPAHDYEHAFEILASGKAGKIVLEW
jgi:threonine 3-dehydrogenase